MIYCTTYSGGIAVFFDAINIACTDLSGHEYQRPGWMCKRCRWITLDGVPVWHLCLTEGEQRPRITLQSTPEEERFVERGLQIVHALQEKRKPD